MKGTAPAPAPYSVLIVGVEDVRAVTKSLLLGRETGSLFTQYGVLMSALRSCRAPGVFFLARIMIPLALCNRICFGRTQSQAGERVLRMLPKS